MESSSGSDGLLSVLARARQAIQRAKALTELMAAQEQDPQEPGESSARRLEDTYDSSALLASRDDPAPSRDPVLAGDEGAGSSRRFEPSNAPALALAHASSHLGTPSGSWSQPQPDSVHHRSQHHEDDEAQLDPAQAPLLLADTQAAEAVVMSLRQAQPLIDVARRLAALQQQQSSTLAQLLGLRLEQLRWASHVCTFKHIEPKYAA
jgi:hypothetical protein